jgi:RNA polymerase sigma-70 factor (ECF subfamily)
MSDGWNKGLSLIDELGTSGELSDYYLYHAARADLLRRLERYPEAAAAYRQAIQLSTNDVEQRYLKRRLLEVLPQ